MRVSGLVAALICLLAPNALAGQALHKPVLSPVVKIPAGWFYMGNESGDEDEKPVHRVWLDEFYLEAHEVTNAQYAAFLNLEPYTLPDRWYDFPDFGIIRTPYGFAAKPGMEDLPVVYIHFAAAAKYCRTMGRRLPTEAEWEKACRGGRLGPDSAVRGVVHKTKANVHRWWRPVPDPIGSYPPNGYKLYDMHGNVAEFCIDRYGENYYQKSPLRNPVNQERETGPGHFRVVRGGDFSVRWSLSRCSTRRFVSRVQADCNNFTGLRCAVRNTPKDLSPNE